VASPTSNKALTYATHGGSINSWDSQLNSDMEILDTVLGGTLSVALAAANVVLSVAQSQNLNYQLTGVLAANVSIQWPAVGGFYIVDNQTTGAFTVTLQTAGAATTTIAPQGYRILVWSNGPDMLPAATAVPGAYSVGGVPSFTSTSHALIPSGTTAQRPGVPAAANFRYNSTLGLLEFYDGTSWNQPSNAQPIAAGFKNLRTQNNAGTPNTQIDITADAVTVETSGGTAYRLRTVSVTINFAVSGAAGGNDLDAGAIAPSTFYFMYVIYNPSTGVTAGLGSLSATAPTLPAGFTAFARLGANRTTAASIFNRVIQYGRIAQYVVAAGSPTLFSPIIGSGITGTFSITSPTLVAASITSVVPTTASRIHVGASNVWKSAGAGSVLVAPNQSYSGANNGPGGSVGMVFPIHVLAGSVVNSGSSAWMTLETTTISWAAGGAGGAIACLGWEDNI